MPSVFARLDDLAGRVTNRLIERLPGPQIDVTTATPVVSFTFDDVPDTALTAGAAIKPHIGGARQLIGKQGLIIFVELRLALIADELALGTPHQRIPPEALAPR